MSWCENQMIVISRSGENIFFYSETQLNQMTLKFSIWLFIQLILYLSHLVMRSKHFFPYFIVFFAVFAASVGVVLLFLVLYIKPQRALSSVPVQTFISPLIRNLEAQAASHTRYTFTSVVNMSSVKTWANTFWCYTYIAKKKIQ